MTQLVWVFIQWGIAVAVQLYSYYGCVSQDYLSIPRVGIHMSISREHDESIGLRQGIWRLAESAQTPLFSGNIILAAHRFRPGSPLSESFYALGSVVVGDEIMLLWQGRPYTYDVVAVTIVDLDSAQLIARLSSKQLTLITCTPLSTSAQRLIVIAKQREY